MVQCGHDIGNHECFYTVPVCETVLDGYASGDIRLAQTPKCKFEVGLLFVLLVKVIFMQDEGVRENVS
jgi:hypothetical protein